MSDDGVWIRYLVDDVSTSIDFYTRHLGFELGFDMVVIDVRGTFSVDLEGLAALERPG